MRQLTPILLLALALSVPGSHAKARSFWTFETGPVRPLALSPDGSRLFAVNTPDNRLEIYDVSMAGLTHVASVPVGLEPCAVAARTNDEAWVVNHLSDSVSVVSLTQAPRVVRTLLVGDEPRDIVFAGPGQSRAFITTAARGQNHPSPADPFTPGLGRASVFVLDTATDQLEVITLFADTPRALASSPDGSRVYVGAFHSGNRSTAISEPRRRQLGMAQPAPLANTLPPVASAPSAGLILGFDGAAWRDALGNTAPSAAVPFSLPDHDVFELDAGSFPPTLIREHVGVGTILFNIAVNPVSGSVYVSNTDANNLDRFEGSSETWGSLRGELHRARISVITGTSVSPRHLNKHLLDLADYAADDAPATADKSLATPLEMVVSADGQTLYVAAWGSSKIGVLSTTDLEDDSFVPDAASHIEVTGGGPGGLVLDASRGRLYVLTRFDNAVSIVDLASASEIGKVPMHNPEPAIVTQGRPFLYDARLTSSNGEASCSACHVFADFDSLAWDLGVPEAPVETNLNPFRVITPPSPIFHPLKGPMTTQTLRGMTNHGPMHWRGDRSDSPGGVVSSEFGAFVAFNVAFEGLLGRAAPLLSEEMDAFAAFALEIVSPPNPIQNLDGSLTASQQSGETFYFNEPTDAGVTCAFCHVIDASSGHFGGDGILSIEGEPQEFKIPHLRNMYQKVGRFDAAGDQVRGFGYLHDGSIDTLMTFLRANAFVFPGGDPQRREVSQFMLALSGELAPVVGQQVTLRSDNGASAGARIDLLIERARTTFVLKDEPDANECDLIVKASLDGDLRGWILDPGSSSLVNLFVPDTSSASPIADADLRALASVPGQELTYTCAPPGSGARIGIDRDEDGELDADDSCPIDPLPGQPDPDGDGVGEICDNCPAEWNASQSDRGGFGAGSLADGVGDACQCGDTTGDGVATGADVRELRQQLAGAASMTDPSACNIVGDSGPGPATCDAADFAALRRRVEGASVSGDPQVCL
jgi:DNA-binding beta-propeller fold protein YncE